MDLDQRFQIKNTSKDIVLLEIIQLDLKSVQKEGHHILDKDEIATSYKGLMQLLIENRVMDYNLNSTLLKIQSDQYVDSTSMLFLDQKIDLIYKHLKSQYPAIKS